MPIGMLFYFALPKVTESRTAQLELVYYLSGICIRIEYFIKIIDALTNEDPNRRNSPLAIKWAYIEKWILVRNKR